MYGDDADQEDLKDDLISQQRNCDVFVRIAEPHENSAEPVTESLNLNFGAGLRSVPGKSLSISTFPAQTDTIIRDLAGAIYLKIIPMLLMKFDWSSANPEKSLSCIVPFRSGW